MQSDDAQQVFQFFPGDLGSVEDYFDPTALPSKLTSKGSLYTGGLYLRAALKEMNQILRLCEELQESHRDLLRATKAQYDYLDRWKKELQILEKRRSIFRPFELVAIRRAKREFRESARGLWSSTLSTSDTLRRALLSIPSADVAPVESESLEKDERISGILAELPQPGEMSATEMQAALAATQRVASMLGSGRNARIDLTPSDSHNDSNSGRQGLDASSSSGNSSSTSSPSYLNFSVSYNIVNNTGSSVPGFTINNGPESGGSSSPPS